MSEWRTFTDREALDHSLAAHVVSKLALGIAARGTAYLVVSGGSTPVDLFFYCPRVTSIGKMLWCCWRMSGACLSIIKIAMSDWFGKSC